MIVFEDVRKTFYDPKRGPVQALDGISVGIDTGITAVLGANGAGKSTLLRCVAGLLLPDQGRVRVAGHDTREAGDAVRRALGYLSLTTNNSPRLSGREMLRYAAAFHDLPEATCAQRIAELSDRFALTPFLDQRCGTLSTGQAQRIHLARTLLIDPSILVLDEPTTGLDLLAARSMVDAVAQMRRPGRSILLCTHLLHEAQALADQVLVLRAGRVVFAGPAAQLGQDESFVSAIVDLVGGSGAA